MFAYVEVLNGQARVQHHFLHAPIVMLQTQVNFAVRLQCAEGRQCCQIVRCADPRVLQQGRRGNHKGLRGAQAPGDQRRVFILGAAHAQGDVYALVEQINAPVGLNQLQLHLGIGREKAHHQLRKQSNAAWRADT